MTKFKNSRQIAIFGILAITSFGLVNSATASQKSFQIATKINVEKLTFTGNTVEGKDFKSTLLLGKKPSVLWFWAPWCAICKNESHFIVAAAKKYKGKVNFIGVGALGSAVEMKEFVSQTGANSFLNLNDEGTKVWSRFGVFIQPTLVFVDTKGKISSKVGPSSATFLEKKLKSLINSQ